MNKLAIISVVLAICFSSAVSANTCEYLIMPGIGMKQNNRNQTFTEIIVENYCVLQIR